MPFKGAPVRKIYKIPLRTSRGFRSGRPIHPAPVLEWLPMALSDSIEHSPVPSQLYCIPKKLCLVFLRWVLNNPRLKRLGFFRTTVTAWEFSLYGDDTQFIFGSYLWSPCPPLSGYKYPSSQNSPPKAPFSPQERLEKSLSENPLSTAAQPEDRVSRQKTQKEMHSIYSSFHLICLKLVGFGNFLNTFSNEISKIVPHYPFPVFKRPYQMIPGIIYRMTRPLDCHADI